MTLGYLTGNKQPGSSMMHAVQSGCNPRDLVGTEYMWGYEIMFGGVGKA